MKIVYIGTPEFAVKPLVKLLDSEHEVAAVISQPDRRKGRGRKMHASPVKEAALAAGIEILQPVRIRSDDVISRLQAIRPDCIVVAAYGQILPPAIIHLPDMGCINIHASLLPRHRGAAPVSRAIINGDAITGVTTMLMDEGMDTGDILLQDETQITDEDTAGLLMMRLSEMGAGLIIRTLKGVERGEVSAAPQAGEASYAPLLRKSDGQIDWETPAAALVRFVNGMNPWPGAFSFLGKERLKILRCAYIPGSGRPGVIESCSRDSLVAGTASGLLSVTLLQPQGRKPMDIRAFMQGRKITQGMQFALIHDAE